METDDDYDSFPPPEQSSPPIHHRKLKRLKKSTLVSKSEEESASLAPIDSFQSQSLESPNFEESSEPLTSQMIAEDPIGVEDLETERSEKKWSNEEISDEKKEKKKKKKVKSGGDDAKPKVSTDSLKLQTLESPESHPTSEGFDAEIELNSGSDGLQFSEDPKEFDGKRSDPSDEKKEKKKNGVKSGGDDAKAKASSSDRRRGRKGKKKPSAALQQLHVESQRLLRETRDATFKPIPVVQKPISSVLEKIRQRKHELLKKTVALQSKFYVAENCDNMREGILDHDSENVSTEGRDVDKFLEVVQEETVACRADVESSLDASHVDGCKEAARQSCHENAPSPVAVEEQSMHAFRAPVDDTQDLFCESQTSEGKDLMYNDQDNSPLEEVLAPSALAMNLKFDSAPLDDVSSDGEDNDNENIEPELKRTYNGCYSPKGDPVKAFVNDEAVEEDDSDNDLLLFQENEEDEDNEDYEELNDLMATDFNEKPIDNERRNELHQKWLEQQDAAGTDNLLQRMKFGTKLKDTTLLEEEEEVDENDEEFGNEAVEDHAKTIVARMNSRKAKQMIPKMFSDKNDGYLSSDGDETERRLVKQRLLDKALLNFIDLSRKSRVPCYPRPRMRNLAKSFFEKMLTGGNNNGSSQSSFLGLAPSHSLPSSRKQGKNTVRGFIFGRDDSNSRRSISMSEDSSDAIPRENRPARNATAKFNSSQSKFSTQSTKDAVEGVSGGTSLFEILKRSSMQSNVSISSSMASPHKGKLFFLNLLLLFASLQVSRVFATSDSVSIEIEDVNENKPEIDDLGVLNRQKNQIEKLEELVSNLSELVSRLESRLSKFGPSLDDKCNFEEDLLEKVKVDEIEYGNGKSSEKIRDESGLDGKVGDGERGRTVSVTKYSSPFWSERFQSVSAVELDSDATCINVLPFRDYEGLNKYFAVGDDRGELTGHVDGSILVHRLWEVPNGEDWSSLSMESIGRFASEEIGEDGSRVTLLEVHHVGRTRPLAFLKQRLLFMTATGAGSLDLRTMKVRESECEGLNHSSAESYVFDATERSKAYGFTSEGDLIHVLLMGDIMNFKCRVRSKRRFDMEKPLAFQAIKGYLLLVNQEKVFVYNVSTQHYTRLGGPRLLFSAGLDEIRASFVNYQLMDVDAQKKMVVPLLASDGEKLLVLGLGGGHVRMYRSILPVFKGESNTMLWTSPVFFFILFLFGAWQFFAKKKEALISWGPDDPFSSTSIANGAPLVSGSGDRSFAAESSSRGGDTMDLRGGGLRGPSRRYVSPSHYPGGSANSFRPTSTDTNSRPSSVDPNFRAPSELKFRGSNLESTGFQKRRESLFANSQVVDDSS
ncbi:hypothetical protein Acr_11g0002400 [Actinidia rufa]|uniref:Uncharacterized protein n=1 Tax=Actinidia rufa TaxID=165716 RepID=A0A7J0FB35_9ERIC|nr:hypothetical protein Acr_11g0002400 [Actinidia rufa]